MAHVPVTLQILALVAVIVAVSAGARRWRYAEPLVLTVVGVGLSLIPRAFSIRVTPDLVLTGLLPPLLYAAAIHTPLVQFRANRRGIAVLAVGAVAFTTAAVGFATWWMLPGAGLAAAMALGAVVAPPDAVAATAVGRRVGMPRRIVALLESESLLNDATALVTLATALGAMTARVHATTVIWDFVRAAGGGLIIGFAAAGVLAVIRRRLTAPILDTTLSFAAPYVAFLPAEELGASGVLAVVVTGLLLGHRSISLQSAASRVAESINWKTVQFVLENVVFLLIGLQVRDLAVAVHRGAVPWSVVVPVCLGVLAAAIVARFAYVFAIASTARLLRLSAWPWAECTIISWAGMRGVVTLAAVFAIPPDTPYRALFAFAAFTVVAGTLLLQGWTLPWLVRRFRLPGPDPVEDALQLAGLTSGATRAGLDRLAEVQGPGDPPEVIAQLEERADRRVNIAWERLGRSQDELEPPAAAYRRLRLDMLAAERDWILAARQRGGYDHEVLHTAMQAIDMEESMLDRVEDATARLDQELTVPAGQGGCEHLKDAPRARPALTPNGCAECLRDGTRWVHLRLCLTCGHVGCCDSSPGRHATAHFAETGHPVIRSFEPGEAWRWCYIDDVLG